MGVGSALKNSKPSTTTSPTSHGQLMTALMEAMALTVATEPTEVMALMVAMVAMAPTEVMALMVATALMEVMAPTTTTSLLPPRKTSTTGPGADQFLRTTSSTAASISETNGTMASTYGPARTAKFTTSGSESSSLRMRG